MKNLHRRKMRLALSKALFLVFVVAFMSLFNLSIAQTQQKLEVDKVNQPPGDDEASYFDFLADERTKTHGVYTTSGVFFVRENKVQTVSKPEERKEDNVEIPIDGFVLVANGTRFKEYEKVLKMGTTVRFDGKSEITIQSSDEPLGSEMKKELNIEGSRKDFHGKFLIAIVLGVLALGAAAAGFIFLRRWTDKNLKQLQGDVLSNNQKSGQTQAQLQKVEHTIDDMLNRIESISEKIVIFERPPQTVPVSIPSDVKSILSDISEHLKQPTVGEKESTERKSTISESEIKALADQMDALQGEIGSLESRFEEQKRTVQTLSNQVSEQVDQYASGLMKSIQQAFYEEDTPTSQVRARAAEEQAAERTASDVITKSVPEVIIGTKEQQLQAIRGFRERMQPLTSDWDIVQWIDSSLRKSEDSIRRDDIGTVQTSLLPEAITFLCHILEASDAERLLEEISISSLFGIEVVFPRVGDVAAGTSVTFKNLYKDKKYHNLTGEQRELAIATLEAKANETLDRKFRNRVAVQTILWVVQPSIVTATEKRDLQMAQVITQRSYGE